MNEPQFTEEGKRRIARLVAKMNLKYGAKVAKRKSSKSA